MLSLRELLAAPKRAVSHRRGKPKTQIAHEQYDVTIESTITDGRFKVFVRVDRALPESFSVGLVYEAEGMADRVILRVNGDHGGEHRNRDGTLVRDAPHVHCHPPDRLEWNPTQLSTEARHAEEIGDAPLILPRAWEVLCARAGITDEANVRGLMWQLHATMAAQLDLDLDRT